MQDVIDENMVETVYKFMKASDEYLITKRVPHLIIFLGGKNQTHQMKKKHRAVTMGSYYGELLENILCFYYLMLKLHVGKILRERIWENMIFLRKHENMPKT